MIEAPSTVGERTEGGLGLARVARSGEMAIASAAAKSKAMVEAKFVIAMNRPRNLMDARAQILEACKRPHFAETARYRKPVGNQTIDGPSIRFAETAIQAMRNIDVSSTTLYEDEETRTVHIAVTDLESNLSYGKDVTIKKTVERRTLKPGQMALSERVNSIGQKTFLVLATEDEIANKVAAVESKVIRNCGLRLVPQDIVEEAMQLCEETIARGGGDPKAGIKKLADAFSGIGVRPAALQEYLGHSLDTISPKELADLRGMYQAIKDGEASWSDYQTQSTKEQPERGTIDISSIKAGDAATHTAPGEVQQQPQQEQKPAAAQEQAQPQQKAQAETKATATEKRPAKVAVEKPQTEEEKRAELITSMCAAAAKCTDVAKLLESANAAAKMLTPEKLNEALADCTLVSTADFAKCAAPKLREFLMACKALIVLA